MIMTTATTFCADEEVAVERKAAKKVPASKKAKNSGETRYLRHL